MNAGGISLGPCTVYVNGEPAGHTLGDVTVSLSAEVESWSRARGRLHTAEAVATLATAFLPPRSRRLRALRSTRASLRRRPARRLRRFPVPTRRGAFRAAAHHVRAALAWFAVGGPLAAVLQNHVHYALELDREETYRRMLDRVEEAREAAVMFGGRPGAAEPFGRLFARGVRAAMEGALHYSPRPPRMPLPELPPYRSPVHRHVMARAPLRLRGSIPWHIRGRGR